MGEWIPFGEGLYLVENGYIAGTEGNPVSMIDGSLEVYLDSDDKRRLKGSGRIENALLVELLGDNETVDLLLDLGSEFKYILKDPEIKGGKVFTPNVQSRIHFYPKTAWTQITENEFKKLIGK